MHDLLKSQLQILGLSRERPPSAAEWKLLLDNLSLEYLDAQLQRRDQDLLRQLEEATLLNRVIAAVTSSAETYTILTTVSKELGHALDLCCVTCALLDEGQDHLAIIAEYRELPDLPSQVGERLQLQHGSVWEHLFESHSPLSAGDLQADRPLLEAGLVPAAIQESAQAVLVIPLLAQNRVVGVINMYDRRPRSFRKREINLAFNVAAAASQALENALLYEELRVKFSEQHRVEALLRQQNAYMQALNETALGLIQRLDLNSLLKDIIEKAAVLLGTRHGFLYVFQTDQQEMILQSGLGIFRHLLGSKLQLGRGLAGEAWRRQETVVASDPHSLIVADVDFGRLSAGICVPLQSEHGLVGLLGLVYLQGERVIEQEQVDLLERFAPLAALALDNARLYSAAQQEIVERQKIEKNLFLAKKMAEAASLAKSTFLARMSHELRTPLTAIIGYSDIVHEEIAAFGEPDLVEDVVRIRRSAQILLDIINDVLDLSKVESGEMTMYLQKIDIFDLLGDVTNLSRTLIERNRNRLVLDVSPEIGLMTVDVTKLRQTLLNLIGNAAKFTHDGTITIRAARIENSHESVLEIDLIDTGIGIAADKQEAVFEPFVQGDDSTTREFGGTGLGLAISRRYCRLMGGDIILDSKPGEGSIFTIRLPVTVEAAVPIDTLLLTP